MKKLLAVFSTWIIFFLWVGTGNATSISSLELISPASEVYILGTDFYHFTDSMESPAAGDVTGYLQYVGFGLGGDFTGFITGNIALIERGGLDFASKINNAYNAGAVGAIIFESDPPGPYELWEHSLASETYIPALFTTRSLGIQLLSLIQGEHDVALHMTVEPVPEPSTIILFVVGLLGLSCVNRKKY